MAWLPLRNSTDGGPGLVTRIWARATSLSLIKITWLLSLAAFLKLRAQGDCYSSNCSPAGLDLIFSWRYYQNKSLDPENCHLLLCYWDQFRRNLKYHNLIQLNGRTALKDCSFSWNLSGLDTGHWSEPVNYRSTTRSSLSAPLKIDLLAVSETEGRPRAHFHPISNVVVKKWS